MLQLLTCHKVLEMLLHALLWQWLTRGARTVCMAVTAGGMTLCSDGSVLLVLVLQVA
jgi:hypothetical protein